MVRPYFDQTEGFALAILDTLAAGRRTPPPPRQRDLEPSEELVRVGAERLNVLCHRLLLEGGAAERTVLRDGRRVSGRLWDEPANDGFRLRFTAASKDLWLGISQSVRRNRTVDRIRPTVEATDTGDWMFYALASTNLGRLGTAPRPDAPMRRRLRSGSPLAALITATPQTPHAGAVQNHLARLLSSRSVRILECFDQPLLAAWSTAASRALDIDDIDRFTARFTEIGTILDAHLAALDAARRLDLARSLLLFAVRFATEIATDPVTLRTRITDGLRPRTMRERTAAFSALARVAAVGARLAQHREQLAGARYGDDRWEEGQLYLREFDAIAAPYLDLIQETERTLRGTIT